MQLVADDPINRSIWAESVALQRKIAERETQPLRVGAQQAMPKPCDQALFSPKRPLPWVSDLVGSRFGSNRRSVLVVASSYNGFIEGYSRRAAVLPLTDYADVKKAGVADLVGFIARFKECVVDRDEDYYQPILRDLLAASGCSLEDCCVTDLCKADIANVTKNGCQHGTRPDCLPVQPLESGARRLPAFPQPVCAGQAAHGSPPARDDELFRILHPGLGQ
jgi:hypothetical protein